MSNQSSDAVKIHRAPNGKSYVWGNGEAICPEMVRLQAWQAFPMSPEAEAKAAEQRAACNAAQIASEAPDA
jgi:hypothetical protein